MAVQDDHMIRNIQDVGRLIAKLLLHEQQPNYTLPENETQIFASKYKLYLPSEEELSQELQREYRALEYDKEKSK